MAARAVEVFLVGVSAGSLSLRLGLITLALCRGAAGLFTARFSSMTQLARSSPLQACDQALQRFFHLGNFKHFFQFVKVALAQGREYLCDIAVHVGNTFAKPRRGSVSLG